MLSREEIRESTKAGENIRGELMIAAENGSRIKGIAYSSHRRFLLGKERFTGEKIEIPYGADVKGLNPGDSFEGELVLSTSIGEYRIPFAIQVEPCRIKKRLIWKLHPIWALPCATRRALTPRRLPSRP